jgi:hypothetical protein
MTQKTVEINMSTDKPVSYLSFKGTSTALSRDELIYM